MEEYIKLFQNHTLYEAYKNSADYVTPNVSYCELQEEVHYNPWTDPCQQYDYVEIAGIKWATKNVGACDVTDTGLYFLWANPLGHTLSELNEEDPITDNYQEVYDKYFLGEDFVDYLLPGDDMAEVNIGEDWKVPTKDDLSSLISNTTHTYVSNYQNSGVSGWVFVDKTDSSKILFFPEVGFVETGDYYIDNESVYWTSEITGSTYFDVYTLDFSSSLIYSMYDSGTFIGYMGVVRPIKNEQ